METKNDNFFMSIGNSNPYFKAAFQGFAGSGKTHTAAIAAIGLYQRIKSQKPVVFFDSEKSARFLKPLFDQHNIQVLVRESKSLADLKEVMTRCREGLSDILIIDSITAVYEDFLAAYKRKVNRTYFQIMDWGILKPSWRSEFSDLYVRDPYHCIFTGRAGYDYEQQINEVTGKKEFVKAGIKMRADGEIQYEPDMLVYMDRYEEILGDDKKVWREATILKDRSRLIDGKTFKNPSYTDFAPVIEWLLTDPIKNVTTPEGNAALLFHTEEEKGEWKRERDRWLEEIEGLLTSIAPGQSSAEKKFKVDILFDIFATTSWVAIQQMPPEQIKDGYERIRDKLLESGLVAYNPDFTITTLKKVEVKNDPKIEEEIKEKIKKSKTKTK